MSILQCTVNELVESKLYHYIGIRNNLYKVFDWYNPAISEYEIMQNDNILVIKVQEARHGYFGIKVIIGEKMGWMYVESTDDVFIPLEQAYPDVYKEAMEDR